MEKILTYVAGPYTRGDTCVNTNKAVRVGNELLEKGYPSIVPHLTHFWHCIFPQEYQTWLDLDMEYLVRCNVLLRLPGESSGADKEVERAVKENIPVVYAKSYETAAEELIEFIQSSGLKKND